MKAKKYNKQIIRKYKKSKKYLDRITLICKKCGVQIIVNTTKVEIYTDEVKKKWICLNCRKEK